MKSLAELRHTKIVATLGPASSDADTMAAMVEAGVSVFRINSSHGTQELRIELMERVLEVREQLRRPVGLLVDLQGPRIRVGDLPRPRELAEGSRIVLSHESDIAPDEIPTTYEALATDVRSGDRILMDDGLLEIRVESSDGRRVVGSVISGGLLRSHKGINLPGVEVSAPTLTDKDRQDLETAASSGADFIGLSFVRSERDIDAVRRLLPKHIRIVAKIELAKALESLDGIVRAADSIMVARGDLGVELPFEEVPMAQKRVISRANRLGRPVITATQMLESMVENPRPTRAEASDVANAVLDGTDAVMLSAETSIGSRPIAAVEAMARIAARAERSTSATPAPRAPRQEREFSSRKPSVPEAIAVATVVAADLLETPLICCLTSSGFTARQIAAARPTRPIVGMTPDPNTYQQMTLSWGVTPALVAWQPSYEAMLATVRKSLVSLGYACAGDTLLMTAGTPFAVPGTTNLLQIETV